MLFKTIVHLATYDFASMYTTTPERSTREPPGFGLPTQITYLNSEDLHVEKTWYSQMDSNRQTNDTDLEMTTSQDKVKDMICIQVDNIYLKFGGEL